MKPVFRFGASFALILAIVVALAAAAAPALAGNGGVVLPAEAKPEGYSLVDAAAATAAFNVGPRTADTLPQDFPFQILYVSSDTNGTFSVKAGTPFYVPVVYSDSTDGAYWPFPDVNDPAAVSAYYFDPQQLGTEIASVKVDGKETQLGPAYAAGAETPGLPTGADSYTVIAAFLSPLTPGVHTVEIAVRLTGAFVGGVFEFAATYTVVVQ